MLINYRFDYYDLKIYFMRSIWRLNGQNYILALETWDVDDMQGNASEVKCDLQNGVSPLFYNIKNLIKAKNFNK